MFGLITVIINVQVKMVAPLWLLRKGSTASYSTCEFTAHTMFVYARTVFNLALLKYVGNKELKKTHLFNKNLILFQFISNLYYISSMRPNFKHIKLSSAVTWIPFSIIANINIILPKYDNIIMPIYHIQFQKLILL